MLIAPTRLSTSSTVMGIAVLALTVLLGGCSEYPGGARVAEASLGNSTTRAIWITRWDYLTEQDIAVIVENCAAAGFNQLMFQVRGNASVFYPSKIEPWAEQLGSQDPGFDPLAVALREAHQRGLQLHTWVNVVPAWWGNLAPTNPAHVLNTHPEWLWYDADGQLQPESENFYLSLNPCLPEVRDYITSVAREIAVNYDIDGMHLDYIRFPNEKPAVRDGSDYPRDARTLALFAEETGRHPDDDKHVWNEWRSAQVTQLLRDIGAALEEARPGLELSAAVGSEEPAALSHFQDWRTWIAEGLLDTVYPMNYTSDDERYATRLADWQSRSGDVRIVMGLHATSSSPAVLLQRMATAEETLEGFCLFGYLSFWDSQNQTIDEQEPNKSAERRRLRSNVLPLAEGR